VLAAVVDLGGADPVGDVAAVVGEIEAYEPALVERVRVVVGNKTDLRHAEVSGISSWAAEHGARFVAVSAMNKTNLDELRDVLVEEVTRAREVLGEPESFIVFRPAVEDRVTVAREDGAFRVRSERAERMVAQTPLGNTGAVRRLQRQLRSLGVETALRRAGANEGDEVRIGETAFEWIPDA
jgi:GTP-binding protein